MQLIGGVDDPQRLEAVARAEMQGHLGDPDLNAVVATLRIACSVPIAVVNVLTVNTQTYPAEVGVGAPCTTVPDAVSFCAEVVNSQATVAVCNARSHPVYANNPMVMDGTIGAYAGVPLVDDGFVLGSVSIFDNHPREFSGEQLELLQHQARLASSVLALRRSARTDGLTGLPNRGLFLDRLTQSVARLDRHDGFVAAIYVDIDNFKDLNDVFGHDVGDWVLTQLAGRLSGLLRPSDTLARLGGDEFAAVCDNLHAPSDVDSIADRMVAAVALPWAFGTTAVSVSIGVAVTGARHTVPADLLRTADAAMYRAKLITGSAWVRDPLSGGLGPSSRGGRPPLRGHRPRQHP